MDEIWFESVVIFTGTFTEEEYKIASRKWQKRILTIGGNKVSGNLMGKRKLAYTLKGSKIGYYTIYQFCVPEELKDEAMHSLERLYRIDDTILKFMNIKLDDAPDEFSGAIEKLDEIEAGDKSHISELSSDYPAYINRNINALDVLLGLAHYVNDDSSNK